MKVTKNSVKKHARKLRNATEEEFKELQEGYRGLLEKANRADSSVLLIMAVVGIAIILLFRQGIFDAIGVIVLVYSLYLFVQKEAHEEGYYEGYYDRMTKGGGASGNSDSNNKEKKSNDDKK